jgi:Protein of unknown function (DUF3433)
MFPGLSGQSWRLRQQSYKNVNAPGMQEAQEHKEDVQEEDRGPRQKIIRPMRRNSKSFSARTIAKCSFIVVLVTCITALLLLRSLDRVRTGFGFGSTASLYYWKYGPTALLVTIIAFWGCLDYLIKSLAPWQQMTKQPTSARQTLLLDYLSPILPSAFYQSFQNQHWNVVLSICVFAFLKLAAVASTALFNPQLSTFRTHTTTALLAAGGQREDIRAAEGLAGRVAVSYIGARQRNLAWPNSTLPSCAFQELSTVGNDFPEDSVVTAMVQAFYPSLDCEIASTTSGFQSLSFITDPDRFVDLHIDYKATNVSGRITLHEAACNPMSSACDSLRLIPFFDIILTDLRDDRGRKLPTNKFFMSLISLLSEQKPKNETFTGSNSENKDQVVLHGRGWTQSVDWISALVCQSAYSIEHGALSVTRATDGGWVDKVLSGPTTFAGRTLPDYATHDLTSDVYDVVESAEQYTTATNKNPAMVNNEDYASIPWFEMMLFEASHSDITFFQDSQAMIDPAGRLFQGLASTWVGTWLNFPDQLTTEADCIYKVWRLRMSDVPFRLMVVALSASLLCVLALLYRHIKAGINMQPGSILTDAKTLKNNPLLHSKLAICGSKSDAELEAHLANNSFKAVLAANNNIQIVLRRLVNGEKTKKTSPSESDKNAYWSPISTKPWFICLTILLTLISIITLEIVQKASDGNKAGLTIKGSVTMAQDLIAVLPALVMLTIAMLFNSTEFSALTTSAYLQSYKGSKPISDFLPNPLQQLPPYAIFSQIRLRHYLASIILFASLLGSTLTIVVSGLYKVDPSPYKHETFVIALDKFDFDTDLSNATAGSQAFTFVQRRNESFPDGTHDEIAYPLFKLNLDDPVVSKLVENATVTSIEVEMPITRASLNCSLIPQSQLTIKSDKYWRDPNRNTGRVEWANITSFSALPSDCVNKFPIYNDTSHFGIESDPLGSVFKGQTSTIAQIASPKGVILDQPWLSFETRGDGPTSYPPGCPSVAFTIGTYTFNRTDTSTTTRIACSQYIESIPAVLIFTVPDLKLDTSNPPVLHEDQASIASRLAWDFKDIFAYGSPDSQFPELDPILLDHFFDVVVNGIDGIPVEELLGSQKQQNFIDAVQHVYRVYMAQVLGNDMRSPSATSLFTSTGDQTTNQVGKFKTRTTEIGTQLKAFVHDTTRLRIIQNRTQKTTLQVILAVMAACLLIGWRDLHASGRLLPHNPCTIAGRMSFVAGTKLVRSIADNADEGEVHKRYNEHGQSLRLGWWYDDGTTTPDQPRRSHQRGHIAKTSTNAVVAERDDELQQHEASNTNDVGRRFGLHLDDEALKQYSMRA